MKIGRLEVKWLPATHVKVPLRVELKDFLHGIATEFGKIEGDVVKEALTLYRWASEAWKDGRVVVIMEQKDLKKVKVAYTTVLPHSDENDAKADAQAPAEEKK